jgi:hypothetical protein
MSTELEVINGLDLAPAVNGRSAARPANYRTRTIELIGVKS